MENAYNDIWCLDMEKVNKLSNGEVLQEKNIWQKLVVKGNGPENISNHSGAVLNNKIYIYGGLINNENVKDSLYSFDPDSNTWNHHITRVIVQYDSRICREEEIVIVW